ncbi:MAG: TIGR00341 family protein [Rhodothermales bacterium]
MALRLVEIYLPEGREPSEEWVDDHALLDKRVIRLEDKGRLIRALINSEDTEDFIDAVDDRWGGSEAFRIVLLPVEATLPREDDNAKEDPGADESEADNNRAPRISREEVYADVSESVKGSSIYYILVLLSTVVAAGGMLRDDVAVVVGAMVIAPLIGPNLALALATTLGDTGLLVRALRVNVIGLILALALSVSIGLVLDFSLTDQVASRAYVDLGSIVLALAAGVAGALSVTRGMSTALIGVMVAVALLPPLVALGMLLGAGRWLLAYNASLLLLINVASVNLASVVTFFLHGIRPSKWYEEEEARKKTRIAVIGWLVLIAALVVAVLLAPEDLLAP